MTDHIQDFLNTARRELESDLRKVDRMSAKEQEYLARVGELEDPITDGIECNADNRV